MSHKHVSRRKFVSTVAAAAGGALLPSRSLAGLLQDPTLDSPQRGHSSAEHVAWKALPFPLRHVRLLPGVFKTVSDRNLEYLKSLPEDRLMHTFRLTAGMNSAAQPLGGWEAPDCELRGHFAGGHYLSACAISYASTGDEEIRRRGDSLVSELAKCQQRNGYLSAFPLELFDRLRDRVKVWAPFYTIHKIMAGLLDMHQLAGNAQALDVLEKMADWVDSYTGPLPYEHMQRVLNTEYGGMGEVLANLYAVTGKAHYIGAAKRFDKKVFFDPLAEHRDELRGLHANTHIPQVIAAARLYEVTGETRYRDIAQYFWDEIQQERMYANGGTSNGEVWRSDPGKLSHELGPSSTEDCCAYNLLKLTRHLFGWNPEPRYTDYYERALLNHRLGTIDPETGTSMYYYPQGIRLFKTYATPTDSFWCCNGTGVEEFGKFADTIYFHDEHAVYVNLFIASELDWPEKGLKLRQETDFPRQQGTKLIVASKRPSDVEIRVRIPYWTKGGDVKVNGRALPVFANPSSYLVLRGPWNAGDTIEVALPMGLHSWHMPDDDSIQAAMFGPMVLVGKHELAPKDKWYGEMGPFERKDGATTPPVLPGVTGKLDDAGTWVEPASSADPLEFRAKSDVGEVALAPIHSILHERYDVYWKVSPPPTKSG